MTILTPHFEKPIAATNFWTLLPFICQCHKMLFSVKTHLFVFSSSNTEPVIQNFSTIQYLFPYVAYTTFSYIFCRYALSPWSSQTLIMKALCCFKTLQTLIQPKCQIPEGLNHLHILCQSIANEHPLSN